jgi:hypothetical protein
VGAHVQRSCHQRADTLTLRARACTQSRTQARACINAKPQLRARKALTLTLCHLAAGVDELLSTELPAAKKKSKKSKKILQSLAGGELSFTPCVGLKVDAKYMAKPKVPNWDQKKDSGLWHPGSITELYLLAVPQVATIAYDDDSVEYDVVFSSLRLYC